MTIYLLCRQIQILRIRYKAQWRFKALISQYSAGILQNKEAGILKMQITNIIFDLECDARLLQMMNSHHIMAYKYGLLKELWPADNS